MLAKEIKMYASRKKNVDLLFKMSVYRFFNLECISKSISSPLELEAKYSVDEDLNLKSTEIFPFRLSYIHIIAKIIRVSKYACINKP